MARPRRGAVGRARAGFGVPDWNKYTIIESIKHPELHRPHDRRHRAGAVARTPFDTLLDLALDEPDLALRVRACS